jgi:hypothetical protein
MQYGTHIDRMKLINALYEGRNLPEAAVALALEHAEKMSTDADLKTLVRSKTKPDLAERDFKRAAQVLNSRKAPALKHEMIAKPTATTPTPKPAPYFPDRLTLTVPFWQTEDAHYATEAYFQEFRNMPVDDFDLESYWKTHRAKLQAEREARRKKPA